MKNVLCPRCKTEHRLPSDAAGYTCSSCGTEWVFAKCAQCHSTFHAPARTASWTCKRCGFRNVSATAPEPEPAEAAAPRPSLLARARTGWSGLSQRGKLLAVGVPVLILVVVIALLLSGGGSGGPSSVSQLAAAKTSYCLHSRELTEEIERHDAVLRHAVEIRKDAGAFRRAGDPATATQVRKVFKAAKKLAAAEQANKGIDKATKSVEKAQLAGPQC